MLSGIPGKQPFNIHYYIMIKEQVCRCSIRLLLSPNHEKNVLIKNVLILPSIVCVSEPDVSSSSEL